MTLTSIPFPPWTEGGIVLFLAEVTNVLFCLAVAVALLAVFRRWSMDRRLVQLMAQMGCGFLVALVFLGEPRYRIPYDVFGWGILGWWMAQRVPVRVSGSSDAEAPSSSAEAAVPTEEG